MKKKEISIAFLVLGSFNQSEETSGNASRTPFNEEQDEERVRKSIAHTQAQAVEATTELGLFAFG